MSNRRTVSEVMDEYGPSARRRLMSYFSVRDADYPPDQITLLAVKDRAELEVWAGADDSAVFIRKYPIRGLSGVAGPKLREGDMQVPEGVYRVEALNPNSRFHLSMKLDYPNATDLVYAQEEGRREPGSNIFIHGKDVSKGCLAMGDLAIEELFVLVVDAGVDNIKVVIAPSDPRKALLQAEDGPYWLSGVYQQVSDEFSKYVKN